MEYGHGYRQMWEFKYYLIRKESLFSVLLALLVWILSGNHKTFLEFFWEIRKIPEENCKIIEEI